MNIGAEARLQKLEEYRDMATRPGEDDEENMWDYRESSDYGERKRISLTAGRMGSLAAQWFRRSLI